MRWFFFPRIGLSVCVLSAALLLLPGASSAQRLPRQESLSLSAAIEEARRSPFHAHDGVSLLQTPMLRRAPIPAALFSWGGSAHPAAQETGGDPQAAAARGRNHPLFFFTVLGIAAGDLLAFSIMNRNNLDNLGYLGLSIPPAAGGVMLAGVPPGPAIGASSLGFASGLAAGLLTIVALDGPLDSAAIFPAVLVYYSVRVGVTMAAVRWWERKEGR